MENSAPLTTPLQAFPSWFYGGANAFQSRAKNTIENLGSESFFVSLRRLRWQTWHLRPCLCRPFRFALFRGATACQSHCFWCQFISKPDRKGLVSKGFFWAPSKIRTPVGHLLFAKGNLASRLHLGIYL